MPELKGLRRALAGTGGRADERLSSIIRTVLTGSQSTPAPPDTPPTPRPAKPRRPSAAAKKAAAKASKADPLVYVTLWGQAAHLFFDCQNIRGFRHVLEPDPDVYQVKTSDLSCRGRRVCGTCKNNSSVAGENVRQALLRFHGAPFSASRWADEGWHRVPPRDPPVRRG